MVEGGGVVGGGIGGGGKKNVYVYTIGVGTRKRDPFGLSLLREASRACAF